MRNSMEEVGLKYFDGCELPQRWKMLGENNGTDTDDDGTERVISYGLVFLDKDTGIKYRLCFLTNTDRYVLVERKEERRGKLHYKVLCDFRKTEIKLLNDFIRENF